MQKFSFKKMHLNISSGKWRPFCLSFNVLTLKCECHRPFWFIASSIQSNIDQNHYHGPQNLSGRMFMFLKSASVPADALAPSDKTSRSANTMRTETVISTSLYVTVYLSCHCICVLYMYRARNCKVNIPRNISWCTCTHFINAGYILGLSLFFSEYDQHQYKLDHSVVPL